MKDKWIRISEIRFVDKLTSVWDVFLSFSHSRIDGPLAVSWVIYYFPYIIFSNHVLRNIVLYLSLEDWPCKVYHLSLYKKNSKAFETFAKQNRKKTWKCMNWYQTIYNHYHLIDIKIGQILLALRDDIATLVKANCEWWSLTYSKTFDNNMIFHENWPCKIYQLSLYKILHLLRHSQKKEQTWKCMSWYQSVFDHYYWIDMKIGQILLA